MGVFRLIPQTHVEYLERAYQGMWYGFCQIGLSLSHVVELEEELKGHVRAEIRKRE